MQKILALKIENLTVTYDSKPVLLDLNLEVPSEKLVAIIGPNGAGKTTLIKSVLNLVQISNGNYSFPILGNELKNKIAYVPQSEGIDWDFPSTVLDIVMMGTYGSLGWIKRPSKKEKDLAIKALDKVNMLEYSNIQINKLSGGQKQRIFIARALVQDAQIYFLDEPLKGVDIQTEKIIIDVLKELRDDGKSIFIVHHNLQTVKEYFDWVVMINSQVIDNGDVDTTFNETNIQKTYKTSITY
ncbi:MAG: metal ABC transporter ATP-binding protein [Peptostreptococcaceae bacterium]